MGFVAAKLVCLIGGQVLTLLRDDRDDIPFPRLWDMPGGGREGAETPEDCVLRETWEEVGITLHPQQLVWCQAFASAITPGQQAWWFAARLPAGTEADIVFGDEGQRWALMTPADWLAHPQAIPHFRPRVRAGLAALDSHHA